MRRGKILDLSWVHRMRRHSNGRGTRPATANAGSTYSGSIVGLLVPSLSFCSMKPVPEGAGIGLLLFLRLLVLLLVLLLLLLLLLLSLFYLLLFLLLRAKP